MKAEKVTPITKFADDGFKGLAEAVQERIPQMRAAVVISVSQVGDIDVSIAGTTSIMEVIAWLEATKYKFLGMLGG